MINNLSQIDVYNGVNFINEVEILRRPQLERFYENQGIKQKRMDSIINIILGNHLAYEIEGTDYIVANRMVSYTKYSKELEKAIWFYVDGVNPNVESDIYNFHCKYPAVLYLASKDKMLDDITCFYIKEGNEAEMCRLIDTNFGLYNTTVNTVILIDNPEQIDRIQLPKEHFNLKYFASVDASGEVVYYQT